jgi:hypothetical protein
MPTIVYVFLALFFIFKSLNMSRVSYAEGYFQISKGADVKNVLVPGGKEAGAGYL